MWFSEALPTARKKGDHYVLFPNGMNPVIPPAMG